MKFRELFEESDPAVAMTHEILDGHGFQRTGDGHYARPGVDLNRDALHDDLHSIGWTTSSKRPQGLNGHEGHTLFHPDNKRVIYLDHWHGKGTAATIGHRR